MAAKLRRDDAIPLYHQIFCALRDEILSGRRPQGSALPTEHELAAANGVSRITARRALDELAQHQLVERRRRIGTRVSFRAPAAPIEANVHQAIESLIAFGRDTRVQVIAVEEVAASPDIAERLRLAPEAPVVRALRVRYRGDEAIGAIESHVPAAFGRALTHDSLARAPLLELLRGAGHVIGSGRQVIAAFSADPALAALLGIEPRAAVIRIERLLESTGGEPLLLTTASYRGDRYRLSLDLQGVSRAPE
jgi:GntR family transcriptional regulator